MKATRWLAFTAILVGLLLAAPMGLVLVASARGGTNLAVVTPSLAWLFWAVPAAALVGIVMALAGALLLFRALRRQTPRVR